MCVAMDCPRGMTRCPGHYQCISDQDICDGQSQCPGGEDEQEMVTSDNVVITCNVTGATCRVYAGHHPASPHSPGVTCAGGDRVQCVPRHVWCDGTCDCDTCQDEHSCDTWQCGQDQFKCTVSGICLDRELVCDGYQDCGENDRFSLICICCRPFDNLNTYVDLMNMTAVVKKISRSQSSEPSNIFLLKLEKIV